MGVSTSTIVKFYTKEKELVKKYYLDDRSDDYIYKGLLNDGGSNFDPDYFGTFTDNQKEIMKIYYDEESGSVSEGYAKVTPNIQAPSELLPIWEKIRTSIIVPYQNKMNDYNNEIIDNYRKITTEVEKYNSVKSTLFSKKEDFKLPEISKPMSEYDFKDKHWRLIWKIDSISKVIGILIVAKENDNLVEITASDF